jgi:hypothetical protein
LAYDTAAAVKSDPLDGAHIDLGPNPELSFFALLVIAVAYLW